MLAFPGGCKESATLGKKTKTNSGLCEKVWCRLIKVFIFGPLNPWKPLTFIWVVPSPTEQTYLFCFFSPSSLEDILRDTTLVFSSALKRGTKLCWNYSNRWAVSMEIKPCLPDEAFYWMVPITENPCGWPWADTFTLRIQSQASISQQRLWLSFISLKESQHMNLCLNM